MRVNREITASQVRVTRQDTGEQFGVMALWKAMDLADQENLDLVETAPDVRPPVCTIMDFGKWRFDKSKEKRSTQVAPKEIRLRPVSNDHDVDTKITQVKRFLQEKRTVSVHIRFGNRELAHKENGFRILDRIVAAIGDVGKVENQPRFEGKTLSVRLLPRG